MTLEPAFRLTSILLAASGFAGLVLTGKLPFVLVAFGLTALVLSLLQVAGHGASWAVFHLTRSTWNAILLFGFTAFLADGIWFSQDLLLAGVSFLVVLMVTKLLTLQQRKDFLHLYAISFLEILASAALTVELWYAAIFVCYLLAAIWSLLLYHLRNEAEDARVGGLSRPGATPPSAAPGPITAQFFWRTNVIAVGAFGLTLAIFFVTPRTGVGFFQKQRAEVIRTSGFSDKVDLGVIGVIKLDQTVVLRVEVPDLEGPMEHRLYFRGAAYDHYDGRSWSNSLALRRPLARSMEGVFQMSETDAFTERPGHLRQEILIEALDTPALFGVPFVQAVSGTFLALQTDGMGNVYLPYPLSARFQYTAFSMPSRLQEHERRAATLVYPEAISRRFLQLPPMSERIGALARQVTSQARTAYEKANALQRHLQGNYTYSLDVTGESQVNPVEDFLFIRKTGYCEHYATAMVVMLRTLGIPARLATGYLKGEWNDFGKYYTVRQRDAHAWVEVFFPRSGWVTFDPTPSEGAVVPDLVLWTQAGRLLDSIRLKWDRFVIQYSFRDQMAVAQAVREQGERMRSQASGLLASAADWMRALRVWTAPVVRTADWLAFAGALIGVALAIVFAGHWARTRGLVGVRSPGLPTARQAAVVKLYGQMLGLLESRGFAKAPGVTPLEFAKRVHQEWADAGRLIEPVTAIYCRVRFGQAPLLPEDLAQAETVLESLRALRRPVSPPRSVQAVPRSLSK